jgi:hypothetical protein
VFVYGIGANTGHDQYQAIADRLQQPERLPTT